MDGGSLPLIRVGPPPAKQRLYWVLGLDDIVNGLRGGHAHYVAHGTNPDVSLDGSALTWESGHGVWLRRAGHTTRVAAVAGNPQVSDGGASRVWAVVFDTPAALTAGDSGSNFDVYMLGKLLWCMVSGRPVLRREWFRRPENDISVMFRNDPHAYMINTILEKCVVEQQKDCANPSASSSLPGEQNQRQSNDWNKSR